MSVPEALADVRLVSESPCRTGKPGRAVGLKGKVVWPGSSRRRPTGDQDSLCWTGKDRKQAVWPGGSRQHPTGGKYSRSGWVSLAGRGVEEVRSHGRGARTGIRWEIKTHCRTGKDGKVKLGSREALAVTRLEMEARSLDG